MAHVGETKRRQGLAIIKAMDFGLGLIRAARDDMGVTDNTLIIFMSDNGAPLRPSYLRMGSARTSMAPDTAT